MQDKNLLNQFIEYVCDKLDTNTELSSRIVQWVFTPNAPKPTATKHVYWLQASCEYVLLSSPPLQSTYALVITSYDYQYLSNRQIPHIDCSKDKPVLKMFRSLYGIPDTKHLPQSSDAQKESITTQSSVNQEPMKMDRTQCYGVIYSLTENVRIPVMNVKSHPKTFRTNTIVACGSWVTVTNPYIYHKGTYGYESLVLTEKQQYVLIKMSPLTVEKALLIGTSPMIGTNTSFALVNINGVYLALKCSDIVNWSVPAEEPVENIPELYIPAMGDYVEVEHPQYSAYGKVVALNDQWIAVEAPNLVITTFEIEQCSITRSSCKKTMLRTKLLQYRYDVDNLEMYVDKINEIYEGQ